MAFNFEHRINLKDIQRIAQDCVDDPSVLNIILKSIRSKDDKIAMNASWVLTHAVDMKKTLLTDLQQQILIKKLNETTVGGIKRNIMRTWQNSVLPDQCLGPIVDFALRFLSDTKEDIAVRAFSITVLENCLIKIPEIKEEVAFVLERELLLAGPAISVRAKRFLKTASRLNQS